MNRPLLKTVSAGFRADVIDRIVEQIYRDINQVDGKILALIQSRLGTSSQVSGDFGLFEIRNGVKAIVEGSSNTITYNEPFSASGATVVFQAKNASNEVLTVALTGQSKASFTISSPDAGALHYFAINIKSSKKAVERLPGSFVR